jgi:hypothetical protein
MSAPRFTQQEKPRLTTVICPWLAAAHFGDDFRWVQVITTVIGRA